jgi:selenocysteine lyase/cysteine desulfurase
MDQSPPAKTLSNRPAPDWDALRAEFPTLRRYAYLDIAKKGPVPSWTEQAMSNWCRDVYDSAGGRAFSMDEVEHAREVNARLLGVPAHTLAFIKNTSEGMSIIARGLGLEAGDNIVLAATEHENNTLPWRMLEAEGVEVRIVPADPLGRCLPADYAAHIDARTRVVTAAWVTYGNGYRTDTKALGELCRAADALLVVDAMQAVGVLATPIAELGADIVVSGGHKALFSLAGAGFLYAREDVIARITPPYGAKYSFVSNDRFAPSLSLAADAHRFEYGNPNFVGLWVQTRSAERLMQIGLPAIEARVRALTTLLMDRCEAAGIDLATPRAWEERAGIVSLVLRGDAEAIQEELRRRDVVVSVKDGRVRAAVHFYNSEHDLDRLMETIRPFA